MSRASGYADVALCVLIRTGVTAGLAAVGWLFATLVATSASADESGGLLGLGGASGVTDATANLTEGTLGSVSDTTGALSETVGSTTKTVTDTVDSTVDTAGTVVKTTTGTVGSVVDTVTGTVDNVIDTTDEVSGAILPQADPPAPSTADDQIAADAITDDQAEQAQPAKRDGKPARQARAEQPAAQLDVVRAVAAAGPARTASSGSSGSDAPSPAGAPVAPATGVALAQSAADGHAAKSATVERSSAATSLLTAGTAVCTAALGSGIDAALPCSSPD